MTNREAYERDCNELEQYRKIGSVEECREAVEKQKTKKCDVTKDNFRIYYDGKKSKNCSNCGQAIDWEESEGK